MLGAEVGRGVASPFPCAAYFLRDVLIYTTFQTAYERQLDVETIVTTIVLRYDCRTFMFLSYVLSCVNVQLL